MEKQKEREKKQLLRHGGGYSGRNSSDRRPFHPHQQQRPPHQYQGRGSTERQQQNDVFL